MAFGVATKHTNLGLAAMIDRYASSSGGATYTKTGKWGAIGTGATAASRTAACTDTALSTEIETRASGAPTVVTTTVTGDTLQSVTTISITGTRAIDEFGLFDASSSGAGNMFFSATESIINLVSGDSLQTTAKVQAT